MDEARHPYATALIGDSEALNRRLSAALEELSDSLPSQVTNAPSGRAVFQQKWLSPPDLHRQGPPVFRDLALRIERFANLRTVRRGTDAPLRIQSMWGMISQPEMEGQRHTHGHSVSAVYYVDAGGSSKADGGVLQFFAERGLTEPSHVIVPKSGLLVIFPSRLPHAVSRYESARPRTAVSASME